MNDDFLKNLSDEQKAQLKNCKTPEDMLAFAKKAGYELSDDALDAVSGGHMDSCSWYECHENEISPVWGPSDNTV
jgi:hypothetical protein